MQSEPSPLDPAVAGIALARAHMRDADLMPALVEEGRDATTKAEILAFLQGTELLGLTTVGKHGWPVSHCMHFAAVAGPADRPVLYLFTHDNRRKLLNVQGDARVGVVVAKSATSGDPAAGPQLKIQGVAFHITDPAEHEFAMHAQFNKPNYEFTRHLGLETQPAIRVDVVGAVWDNPASGSAPVTVDYASTFDVAEG